MQENEFADARRVLASFLAEMKKWNDLCNLQSKRSISTTDLRSPRERLQEVISTYCTPRDISCVGMSFSKPSKWDPEETIRNIETVSADELHITTCLERETRQSFLYILLRVDGNWRVDGRYALYEDGSKYASIVAPKIARRSETLWNLYEKYALLTFVKQAQLAKIAGESDWTFATDVGKLCFSNGIAWKCQILGTESESSFTWLWSWANSASDLPADLTKAANALKTFGAKQGIEHFTEPTLPINEVDGDFISTLATGLFNAGGYYRAPYDGGTAFLLITDESIPEIAPAVLKDWENRFEAFLAANENLSRRRALFDFLIEAADMVQEPNSEPGNEIGDDVEVKYDKLGRISEIRTVGKPGSGNIPKMLALVGKLFSGFRGK